MRTTVRNTILADITELERVADESGLSPWTRQGYVDEIERPDSIFLTIETDDRGISGFIVGRIVPGPDAEIYNIAVTKKARRHGLGQSLLTEFVSQCRNKEVGNIWLEVRQSNLNAINFYKGSGFAEISLRPSFYNDPVEDAVIMKLKI